MHQRLRRFGSGSPAMTRGSALLLLFAVQGLSWFTGLATGTKAQPNLQSIVADLKAEAGGVGDISVGGVDGERPLSLDEIDLDELPGDAGSRKLMGSILGGPLPGLTVIPGFPGPKPFTPGAVGFLGRMGALGEAAFVEYVVAAQDPVAIALRQLSLVAITSYGTAVQNSIKRATARIDNQLARYSAFLKREAKALKKADAQGLLAMVQSEIRALVLARAALKDMSAREVSNVKFLTAAASAWTSWFYGIQYRFTTLTINIQFATDPLQLELNRVLYSLGDVTKLVGLLLKPFTDAFKFEQNFFNTLYNIIFKAYVRERNRLTITPVATLMYRFGSGQNIQYMIDRATSLAQALGTGANADALLTAARAGRNQVAAALRPPSGMPGGGGPAGRLQALERLAAMLRSRAAASG